MKVILLCRLFRINPTPKNTANTQLTEMGLARQKQSLAIGDTHLGSKNSQADAK